MSLFKARDWWSAALGEGEEFDQGCICVGDVDNSGTGHDKVVVGSYMGMLRIFSPHASKLSEGGQGSAEAQLLEVHLQNAIIQVELGKFVSCSDLLHLAVLHPRKLSVFSVLGTAGNVEHGDQYQVKLVYEHNLQRTACNMTYGAFGGVTGHHSLCIQSMDGMLMFFEQDSYSFGRFLPGFLLPGPLAYNSRTDSFLTVSSARQLESYKYETLAVATEAERRQDADLSLKGGGKRLSPDWTMVLGELALDISVPSFSHSSFSIFVLGERNLYCFRDNGQIRFMKKLEYNPSCFLPYASLTDGTTNLLLGNHTNMLLVYQDVTLKWAAQLAFVPVALRVANFPDLRGALVSLSWDGHLLCSYMGTDPSFFSTPKVDSREVDYEQVDAEMKRLHKFIREASRTQDILRKDESEEDLTVTASVSPSMDSPSVALIQDIGGFPVPSVRVKVKVKANSVFASSKLTITVQPPLAVTQDQFVLEPLGVGSSTAVEFSAFLNGRYPPADLNGDIAVSYSSPTEFNPKGVPHVLQSRFTLPLALVCTASSPNKTSNFKITVDTNQPPVDPSTIFPEFAAKSEDNDGNSLAFHFLSGGNVTVLASKTSQRYRIQSNTFEDMWLVVKELVHRVDLHFSKLGVNDFKKSVGGPLPLQEYFLSVDHHFQLRVSAQKYQDLLSERAVQFRAIQRRLLTRFKDKTPAPLQNLDTLLDATYSQQTRLMAPLKKELFLFSCLTPSFLFSFLSLSFLFSLSLLCTSSHSAFSFLSLSFLFSSSFFSLSFHSAFSFSCSFHSLFVFSLSFRYSSAPPLSHQSRLSLSFISSSLSFLLCSSSFLNFHSALSFSLSLLFSSSFFSLSLHSARIFLSLSLLLSSSFFSHSAQPSCNFLSFSFLFSSSFLSLSFHSPINFIPLSFHSSSSLASFSFLPSLFSVFLSSSI
uniref:protein PTHB1 isoform X3 n=1 Tax=Doryrhamphus excisus TaxID=161450 RepID=UPI0025AE867A|nr:protein PTHB1 isoform X3 [Doryrhamphus excisus]